MNDLDKLCDQAWNKLKYACKDVGGSNVKLEVEIGQFKRVVKELANELTLLKGQAE